MGDLGSPLNRPQWRTCRREGRRGAPRLPDGRRAGGDRPEPLKGRRKGFVFQTDVGKPLKPDYLGTQLRRFRKHLQRKLEKAAEGSDQPIPAVPPFTHRGFRRTFATRGVRSGDLKGTQHLLGHASADMTADIYAEPEDGAMRTTVEAIQASVGYRVLFAKE